MIKPDIVFFGERLPDTFDRAILADRDKVDLLITMGTSLKVQPVASIMSAMNVDMSRFDSMSQW